MNTTTRSRLGRAATALLLVALLPLAGCQTSAGADTRPADSTSQREPAPTPGPTPGDSNQPASPATHTVPTRGAVEYY